MLRSSTDNMTTNVRTISLLSYLHGSSLQDNLFCRQVTMQSPLALLALILGFQAATATSDSIVVPSSTQLASKLPSATGSISVTATLSASAESTRSTTCTPQTMSMTWVSHTATHSAGYYPITNWDKVDCTVSCRVRRMYWVLYAEGDLPSSQSHAGREYLVVWVLWLSPRTLRRKSLRIRSCRYVLAWRLPEQLMLRIRLQ